MNRVIKFRGWDEEKKIMFPVFDLNWDREQDDTVCCLNFQFPLMQYTGHEDKNGKEIYENDFYNWVLRDGTLNKDRTMIVKWETEDFSWNGGEMTGFHIGPEMSKEIVIIGNIYENSELLNQ